MQFGSILLNHDEDEQSYKPVLLFLREKGSKSKKRMKERYRQKERERERERQKEREERERKREIETEGERERERDRKREERERERERRRGDFRIRLLEKFERLAGLEPAVPSHLMDKGQLQKKKKSHTV